VAWERQEAPDGGAASPEHITSESVFLITDHLEGGSTLEELYQYGSKNLRCDIMRLAFQRATLPVG
jgi:hypothetical protein